MGFDIRQRLAVICTDYALNIIAAFKVATLCGSYTSIICLGNRQRRSLRCSASIGEFMDHFRNNQKLEEILKTAVQLELRDNPVSEARELSFFLEMPTR